MSNIPALVDPVYDTIREVPGIDTPMVCLMVFDHIDDPGLRGPELARWLMNWCSISWSKTCATIDHLLDKGVISFSDDGELRVTGC